MDKYTSVIQALISTMSHKPMFGVVNDSNEAKQTLRERLG